MCLIGALLTTLSAGTVGSTSVPATHDSVRWSGRTLRQENGTVKYSYAGVSFKFTVTGATRVSMAYASSFPSGAAEMRVYVDGELETNITLQNAVPVDSPATVGLASGLSSSKSYNLTGIYITDPITLSWDTLPAANAQTAISFSTDGGIAQQPPIAPTQRRLDIYGDSITAGNQIDPKTCQPDWAGTYGRILCDAFDANCTCAAISGKGIFANCCDTDVTMDVLGLRLLPGDPSTEMSKQYYIDAGRPAGVLINLGTNDWSHVGRNVTGFIDVYVDFVRTIAGFHGYPAVSAPVFFCAVGPITHSYGLACDEIVAALNGATPPIVAHAISMTTPVDRCFHPPYNSHVMMAEQARPVIAKALGWD